MSNTDNMLALIKNGLDYLALKYCSLELKKDINFLKKAALDYHYVFQDEFFNQIDSTLKNNKELLDIFASKIDEKYVKQSSNEKIQLEKLLSQNSKNQKITYGV